MNNNIKDSKIVKKFIKIFKNGETNVVEKTSVEYIGIEEELKEQLEKINKNLINSGRVQHINNTPEEADKYYDSHKNEFVEIGKTFLNISEEEYKKLGIVERAEKNMRANEIAKTLFVNYPIIFEIVNETINNINYQSEETTKIQKELLNISSNDIIKTLKLKNKYVKKQGIETTYEHNGEIDDNETLYKIGSQLRKKSIYDNDYITNCIGVAKICYEFYPELYEFYDELFNGYKKEQENNSKKLIK